MIHKAWGSEDQERSFCYVEDAVNAFLLAVRNEIGFCNLLESHSIKIKDLAKLMISKISPEVKIFYTGDSWNTDIKRLVSNNSKIKNPLGFKENFSLKKGIEKNYRFL